MPDPGTLVVATGRRGDQGPQGAQPAIPEPASDYNGRNGTNWVPVLPLTGGWMSGGINLGYAAVAPGNLSRHIDLFGGEYGLNFTNYLGGTMTLCAAWGAMIDFYNGGVWALSLAHGEVWWQWDGWRLTGAAGGDYIYRDWNYNPLFGHSEGMGQWVSWSNWYFVGAVQFANTHTGVQYANIVTTYFKFMWNGFHVYARLDNWLDVLFENACDEILKEDIAPARFDCLATLRKIRLYEYRWKDHRIVRRPRRVPDTAPLIPIGFVAQRLAEDFPDGVQNTHSPPVEKLGPWDHTITAQNVDTNTMLALLTGAVQELDHAITQEEQRRAAAIDQS